MENENQFTALMRRKLSVNLHFRRLAIPIKWIKNGSVLQSVIRDTAERFLCDNSRMCTLTPMQRYAYMHQVRRWLDVINMVDKLCLKLELWALEPFQAHILPALFHWTSKPRPVWWWQPYWIQLTKGQIDRPKKKNKKTTTAAWKERAPADISA